MPVFTPIASASSPGTDLPGGAAEGPFLTQSGHSLLRSIGSSIFFRTRQSVDMTDVEVTSAQAIATQITSAENEIKALKMTASQLTPVVNSSLIWPSGLSESRCW